MMDIMMRFDTMQELKDFLAENYKDDKPILCYTDAPIVHPSTAKHVDAHTDLREAETREDSVIAQRSEVPYFSDLSQKPKTSLCSFYCENELHGAVGGRCANQCAACADTEDDL